MPALGLCFLPNASFALRLQNVSDYWLLRFQNIPEDVEEHDPNEQQESFEDLATVRSGKCFSFHSSQRQILMMMNVKELDSNFHKFVKFNDTESGRG